MQQQPPSYQTTDDDIPDAEPTIQAVSQANQSAQDPIAPPSADAIRTARAVRRRPLVRYLGFGFLIVVILILVGVGAFQIQRAQRSAPLNVEVYPGAKITSQSKPTTTSDQASYSSTDATDKVGDFYIKQLGSTDESGCKRIFTVFKPNPNPDGEKIPSLLPGDSFYRCVIDNSFLDARQEATIDIAYEPKSKLTRITIKRTWGN